MNCLHNIHEQDLIHIILDNQCQFPVRGFAKNDVNLALIVNLSVKLFLVLLICL